MFTRMVVGCSGGKMVMGCVNSRSNPNSTRLIDDEFIFSSATPAGQVTSILLDGFQKYNLYGKNALI